MGNDNQINTSAATSTGHLPHSIVVLPFANMSADQENEYFCDGITEEIINALTRIPGLKVTSRTSSFYFKNRSLPVSEIAQQLKVSLVLEGSIRRAGEMMRITAQLIEANEDFHFWSETWDRKVENIFALQDEISLLIADKAREFLGHFEIQDQLVVPQTESYQAYEWFLKGRFHFRKWNPEDAKISVTCFEKALAVDPQHAESMLGLADALGFLATTGAADHQTSWTRAGQMIHAAMAINDQLPEAHYQLSNLLFFTKGDYNEALQAALQAHRLKPNYAEANQHLCFLYLIAGEIEKARPHLAQTATIDPLSQETQFFQALFAYMQHDFAQSLAILDKSLVHNPLNVPAHTLKCYCLLHLGRLEETVGYFDALPAGIVVEGDQKGIEALYYVFKKDYARARECLAALEQRAKAPDGFRENSFLLFLYALLQEPDQAFAWVAQEQALRSPFLLIHYCDVLVDPLKTDPRYETYRTQLYAVNTTTAPNRAGKKALLTETEANAYTQKLQAYLQSEKPYLDSQLSLKLLAQALELHPNQLSWLINEKMGGNFNQFINDYRIEQFKQLAQNPANAHLSILGLAYESGFNSKTVFNTYFKKAIGMTPKQWIQQESEK
ncbi:adenylate cyclase [marine bacterium AO1-C]|nr:adenylate cyclase [marine bacterium AO1-C]